MKKQNLVIIVLIIFAIILGLYSYFVSAINLQNTKSISHSEKLMPNMNDPNVSTLFISNAEKKIAEVELLLTEVHDKDLSIYSFLHRQFLENMISLVEKKTEESKNKLIIAKKSFTEEHYSSASENAYLSLAIASALSDHLVKILEGREKNEWNKEATIEEIS